VAPPIGRPIVRIAELEIDPAQIENYRALLSQEIEASIQLEEGVLALYALAVKGSPEKIRIFEIYTDQEAYEAHLQSWHFLEYKASSSAMVRSLRLIETEPIALADKSDDQRRYP
jgi:quinol monooxygenase YgiN